MNKKKVSFKNFKLKKFEKLESVKDKNITKNINMIEKKKRFKKNQSLIVLYFKNHVVCFGWMSQGTKWHVSEINKEINIKNKIFLYDFFTLKKFRNRGFYTKILKLSKNSKTKKRYLIYCLSNNYASKKAIKNSNFNFVKSIRKNEI